MLGVNALLVNNLVYKIGHKMTILTNLGDDLPIWKYHEVIEGFGEVGKDLD